MKWASIASKVQPVVARCKVNRRGKQVRERTNGKQRLYTEIDVVNSIPSGLKDRVPWQRGQLLYG